MRIYVASSWRNAHQPAIVAALRDLGHEVYDFRHPGEGERGFAWSDIDPNWQHWSVQSFCRALGEEYVQHAFRRDQGALEWCETCVLVLPCGMSAHLEAGWCAGKGKPVLIYAPELREAELMYKLFDLKGRTPICETLEEIQSHLVTTSTRG